MNKGKSLLAGAAVLFSGALLTACGQSKGASEKQVLNWMTSAEIITMDPSEGNGRDFFHPDGKHHGGPVSIRQEQPGQECPGD